MIDAHLHLQDARLSSELDAIVAEMRSAGIMHWAVNGTGPHDWDDVSRLSRRYNEVVAGYGVHPWKVNSLDDGWEAGLIEKVRTFPNSFIGEIGLDKWIRDHDIDRQKKVFVRQLEIASEFNRSVTIHCLRAWGHLLECLRDTTPSKPFLLHSFAGPREMIEPFLELGAFFSLSGYFFRQDKREKLALFSDIPEERILLETDAPDMMPPQEIRTHRLQGSDGGEINHPANLGAVYQAYNDWRGTDDPGKTVAVMRENFARFLS